MSPRHNRKRRGGRERSSEGLAPDDEARGTGGIGARVETWADGDWMVRPVTGTGATKSYRCPGCDQLIAAGTPHLVTWPAGVDADTGLAARRHWHRPCWQARDRRRANVQRTRNAPRYG